MAEKPNVLIFGGLSAGSPHIAKYLLNEQGGLVSHVRVVDKYSIKPATTYVGKYFLDLVDEKSDLIEYRQANLTRAESVAKSFSDPAPNGKPYTRIFDLSGDFTYDRSVGVHVNSTFQQALLIATEAASRVNTDGITAYLRLLPAFYDFDAEKNPYKEEDMSKLKPAGVRGVWWHEAVRAVGKIQGLPLVVMGTSYPYGPFCVIGEVATSIILGLCYKHLNQEMKFLWSPKLRKNTIHIEDVAGIFWAASEWITRVGTTEAIEISGVAIPPSGDKHVKEIAETIKREDGDVVVPLFFMVDDTDTTQDTIGSVMSKVYGIQYGFHGALSSHISSLNIEEIVQEVNDLHMGAWTELITTSNPPVPNTPLQPYANPYQLLKHGVSMDGGKVKKILRYQLRKPLFNEDTIREVIEGYRREGTWPETKLYPPT